MHRKRWSLTQDELARLLGVTTQVAISQCELGLRGPSADILIGSEVIFGAPPRELFPAAYGAVEDEVMARAKLFYEYLETRPDLSSAAKLKLLTDMIRRAEGDASRL